MSTKDFRSISYIYNEMDPSEKVEFERDLHKNSDLLIEVECLKKISQTLEKLEPIEPPAEVVDAVCQSARKNSNETGHNYWKPILYSAAAFLLIGVTSGILLVDNQRESQKVSDGQGNNALTESSASVAGSSQFIPHQLHTTAEQNYQPWVDNNEVLYFKGQSAYENSVALDSIRSESFKKLTPVNPSGLAPNQRQLHLTGSRN